MRHLTEQQIVEAVREGRREGQDALVCRYAERDSYDPQKASLSTWLCRIAYRLTLDFLKRRRPLIVSIEESEVWQEDISDEQLESELSTGREERIQRLQELIDELPDEERLLLTLYYFEGCPLTEIAYITGIEPGPLANRLYRTRKKLLRRLNIED